MRLHTFLISIARAPVFIQPTSSAVAAATKQTQARWKKLKAAGAEAIVRFGGTISHQHGVGKDHAKYLPAEKGALGIAAIQGLVEVFDPQQQMNPGKLLP